MALTASTRLAWLGVAVFACATIANLLWQNADEQHHTSTYIEQVAPAEIGPEELTPEEVAPQEIGRDLRVSDQTDTQIPAGYSSQPKLAPAGMELHEHHRSPEACAPIDALAKACRHPNPSIKYAAIRVVLTRFIRNEVVAARYHRRCGREMPDSPARNRQFCRGFALLERHGWAREQEQAGQTEHGRHNTPPEAWNYIVDGYEEWRKDWEQRHGTQMASTAEANVFDDYVPGDVEMSGT